MINDKVYSKDTLLLVPVSGCPISVLITKNFAIMYQIVILILLSIIASSTSYTQQISQWRGLNRNGIYNETNLLKEWPEGGPELLWSVKEIGKGYSSVSVYKNTIYITGMIDTLDYITAIDSNGNKKWQVPYGRAWNKSFPETRCTPTIENDKIYIISGQGELSCMDAANGEIKWTVGAYEKFDGRYGEWGVSESLLLVDDKVIYTPGGPKTTMVALDKETGETVWMTETLNDTTAYVSPILLNIAGRKIVVNVTARYIFGVDASNGKIVWDINYSNINTPLWHPMAPVINANSPVFKNDELYVTSGYNHAGVKLKLTDDLSEASLQWIDTTLDCHIGGVVLVDGYIYGSNWINNSNGNWCCIDWNTGKTMYEKEWKCKGSIISAEGMLYCYDEKYGNVALVKATPKDFVVISSFKITQGRGPYWAHPVIHDGILYIRHGDVLMAYSIKNN